MKNSNNLIAKKTTKQKYKNSFIIKSRSVLTTKRLFNKQKTSITFTTNSYFELFHCISIDLANNHIQALC